MNNGHSVWQKIYQNKAIFIIPFLLLLGFFSISKTFDEYGAQYSEEGFQRSLVAFAIAKGLNGAISIVQGTEVALEPAGIGVILTPGQILDPANDLIERFSGIMLLCTTSLGIQSILLSIFSSQYFSILVAVVLLISVFLIWRNMSVSDAVKNNVYRAAAFLVILRFFIPVMAIASEGLYKGFLETRYIESTRQLESSDKAVSELSKESMEIGKGERNLSWYESLSKNISSTIDTFDVERRVDDLKREVESMTTHLIDLIIVFSIQTILFPLLFFWLTVKLIKSSLVFRFYGG